MFTNTLSTCQYKSFLEFEAYSKASTQGNRSMLVTQPVSPRSFFWGGEVTAHMSSSTLGKLDLSGYDENYVIKADFMLLEGADSKFVKFFVQFDNMSYSADATMNKGRKTTVTIPLSKFQTRERCTTSVLRSARYWTATPCNSWWTISVSRANKG